MMKRFRRGLVIDEDHLLQDVILAEGFDANYLGHRTTAKRYREEHVIPQLFPAISHEDWEARGMTHEDIAHERLMKILAEHEPIEHPPEVLKEIERVVAAAEAALLHK